MHSQEKTEKLKSSEKEARLTFNEGTVTLRLNMRPDQETFSWLKEKAAEEGLFQKSELHITLIGRETGEIILTKLGNLAPGERERILKQIYQLSAQFSWSFSQKPEYYYVSKEYADPEQSNIKEERKSYIQVVDLPDIAPFYEKLNSMLNLNLEIPFPHITLFTTSTLEKNRLRGIGIYSKYQFESLNPKKIDPDRAD